MRAGAGAVRHEQLFGRRDEVVPRPDEIPSFPVAARCRRCRSVRPEGLLELEGEAA
jgi:hypothetical protein